MTVTAADLMVKFSSDTKGAEDGIKRVNKGITGFAKSAASVGAGILGAQAFNVITRGFQGAGSAALDFGKQMANVNSIAQLSDGAFAKLNDQVLALTSDPRIAQAPATLAAGLYDVYSSGFQGADGLKVLQQSALAATAGVTDTATAARVITANLNAFGLGAGDAQRVSDVLFQTVNDGVITFEQLANNMGNVIPIANSLGLSVEDVGAAYAQMTLKGVPASQAETQIAGLMRSAINPTEALTEAVQAHGFASASAAIESEGLAGFLDIVSDAAGGNQETMFDLLGTQEAMNAATILGADGSKAYRKELDKMNKASKGAGATNKALAQQMKSASFQIAKAKQQVLTLATVGFGILAPVVGKVAGKMTGFISKTLIPFTSILGRATRANFTFGKGFDKLLKGIPQPLRRTVHAIASLTDSLSDMWRHGFSKNEMTQAFHAFQALGEEIGQAVHWTVNLIVDAAVELGTLLIDGVKAAPGAIFGWVRGKLFGQNTGVSQDPASPMYNMKGKPIDAGVWDVAVALGKVILNGATGAISDLWGWVRSKIVGTGGSVSQDPASPMFGQGGKTVNVGSVIISAVAALGGELLTASQNLTDWIKGKLSWPADGTFNFGDVTLKGTVTAQDSDGTPAGDTAGKDTIDRYVQSVKNNLQPVHDAGVEIATYLFGGIGTGIGLAAGAMVDIAGAIVLGIVAAIKDPTQLANLGAGIEAATQAVIDITGWSFTGFGRIVDAFYGNLRDAFNSATPDLSFITDWIFGGISDGASQDPASPMYGGTAFAGIVERIQQGISDAINNWTPDFPDIGSKITTAIGTDWVDALATFTSHFKPDFGFIGTAITTALEDAKPDLPGWLTDFSWITDPIEKLKGYIQELLGLKTQANTALAEPGVGRGTGHEQAGPYAGYPLSGIPQAPSDPTNMGSGGAAFPVNMVFRPDTESVTKSVVDAKTAGDAQFVANPIKATIDGDNGPFAIAYTNAFSWGTTFAAQTFKALLSGDNGPMATAYTAAFSWGDTFAAQDFQATLSADNGPAAIAYTNAFSWGNVWASQVFTATFSINTAPLYAALDVVRFIAGEIAALLPHSPAKKGPLSKPISFAYIADAARRDLKGVTGIVNGALSGSHRVALAGSGRGGTVNVFALKSDELARLMKQAETGHSFAHSFPRDLHLNGAG